MKMKLLDYTLMTLLAGSAAVAWADDATVRPAETCAEGECSEDGKMLFRLRSESYDRPVTRGTSRSSSSQALAPDRRVSIGLNAPGQADVRGSFSFSLPDGGVIWATEDPTLGKAELTASGPAVVAFDAGRITKPVNFYVRSNYPAFIERMELLVYRSSDTDFVTPLATVPLTVGAVVQTEWDGALLPTYRYRVGDELI